MVSQAKQIQIDDLLLKLNGAGDELERLREEKDQEILILQEGMDATIQQLSESQQVMFVFRCVQPPLTSSQNQTFQDDATNAQIDTLILDNRKKLNQIIGMRHEQPTATRLLTIPQTRSCRRACKRSTTPSTNSSRRRKRGT
jgi:hypothetical protein